MDNHKHILIIDDNQDTTTLLEDFLGGNGFSIDLALTGKDGLQRIIDHRPDLIILDLYLPDMMGSDICTQLRSNPATRDIPIILCTAHQVSITEKVKSFRAGVDDYLIRPFELAELLARITAILRRSQVRPKDELLAGIQSVLSNSKPASMPEPPKAPAAAPTPPFNTSPKTASLPQKKETQALEIFRRLWQILNFPSEVFVKARYAQDFFLGILFVVAAPVIASFAKISDPAGGFDAWIGFLSLGIVTNMIMWFGTAGLLHLSMPFQGVNLSMRRSLAIAGLAWTPRVLGAAFSAVYGLLALAGLAVQPDHFTAGISLFFNVDVSEWLIVLGNVGVFDLWSAWITLVAVWMITGTNEKKWTPITILIGATCLLFGALTHY